MGCVGLVGIVSWGMDTPALIRPALNVHVMAIESKPMKSLAVTMNQRKAAQMI